MRHPVRVALGLAISCAAVVFAMATYRPTELTEEQKAEIAAEVNAVDSAFRAASYPEKAASYYLNSPDFTSSHISSAREDKIRVFRGFAAFDDFLRPAKRGQAHMDWRTAEKLVTVLARDVVQVLETGTAAVTDTAGVTTPTYSFTYTYVWVRRDGEWKIQLANAAYVR